MPRLYKLFFYLLSIFIFNLILSTTSFALNGLTVSPIRSELDITPGTSLDGALTVTNSTNSLMRVKFESEEFKVINQQYDYAFSQESDISKWITFENNDFSLEPGKKTTITFNVGVPLSTEPGGRYASIFVSTDTEGKGSSAGSVQRIASLLYINILGDVSRFGKLISLNTPWLISDKSSWSAAIQNSGTTHFRSRYGLKIYTIFGDEVSSFSDDSLILPGTIRMVKGDLKQPFLPGFYKVVYTIGLGDTPAKIDARFFIYIPLWSIAIFVALFIILTVNFNKVRLQKKS